MTSLLHTVAWRRRGTRVAALVAGLLVVGYVAAALAFMSATGSGTATASVGAMNPPPSVAGQQAGADVTVSWGAATLSSGAAVQGYTVARSGGPTICGSPTLVAGLSCTDTDAPSGAVTYVVTAVYNSFTATAASASIAVLGAPTITASPSDPSADTAPTFSYSGGGGSGFQCQLDSGPVAACLSPKSYPGTTSGEHTFRVRATEGAVAGAFGSHSWTLDTSAPAISAQPSDPSADVSPAFSFDHGRPAYSFECRLDAAAFSPCTSPKIYPAVAEGSRTFQVRGRDADGATTQAASTTWLQDTTGPTNAFPPAGGLVWDNQPDTIGRANLDGTGVNQNLIGAAGAAKGVAADASHLFWSNETGKAIGRSDHDGSNANRSFITGPFSPYGVAVDDAHVYWSDIGYNAIGRANLDGSDVRIMFVTGANGPLGIAVDDSHIYWANINDSTIGRANLDGSGANQSFITGANYPGGVAVSGSHVYWTALSLGAIGRANLDGSSPDSGFMTGVGQGVAVGGTNLYFTSYNGIGRADLDGSNRIQNLVSGATSPHAVAVVPVPATSFLAAGTLYYNGGAAGSLQLTAAVADGGSGPAAATFPAISTAGWTHAAETITNASGSYTSSAFSWTASPGNPAGYAVTSADAAGNSSAPSPLAFVNDTTAPAGGALSVNGTAATAGGSTSTSAAASFAIDSRGEFAESTSASDSGLKASTLTVQTASLSAGACGAAGSAGPFASPVTVAGTTQPAGIVSGYCYFYTLTGSDNVGNAATMSTTVQAP